MATFDVLKEILPMYEKEEPKESISGFVVTGVKRWTKSPTLDRLYISNNQNKSIYYDISNDIWVTAGFDQNAVIAEVLKHEGKDTVASLL